MDAAGPHQIPASVRTFFQEYDLASLDVSKDANLLIQRILEFGDWDELRWLFQVYRKERIRAYLRQYGERGLTPVAFNYWRKLLGIRKWRKAPFSEIRGELWNP